ncbi:MAG TPA: tannase/feruloyl esterase family alpha/beta hydrolase, partial [Elusimicrobiales bacterium]|nr:tannase/feruloyl esterase family alpha/beta hydrolase [Elusimicrobiales bacterium]
MTLPLIAVLILSLPPASSVAQALPGGDRPSCEGLRALAIPDLRLTDASPASSGSAICRVSGVIGKEINFELLLPGTWNGIFVMGGGGGFSGKVQNSARWTADYGYATSGTDTGHVSTASMSAAWALESPERRSNFGHLAVHRTAEVSKALIAAYYGKPPERSYFTGCSCGGGQAMSEAQRYPEDFDGIVSGAPAYNATALAAEFVSNTQALYPDGLSAPPIISTGHLRVIQDAVLRQCDLTDGIADGILNDPAGCGFDFSTLPRCGAGPGTDTCFNGEQLSALRTVYGATDAGDAAAYPGFPFGGENEPGGWNHWIIGPDRDFLKKTGYPTAQSYFGIETF